MTILTTVTLTGVDHHIDLDAVDALSTEFPIAEWGAVYAGRMAGANPTEAVELDWLWRFAANAQARRWRFALIAKGEAIGELLKASNDQDWDHSILRVALCADRVHFGAWPGPAHRDELAVLERRLLETDFPVEITVPRRDTANPPIPLGVRVQQGPKSACLEPTASFCGLQGQRVGFTINPFAKDLPQAMQRAAMQTGSSQLRVQVEASELRNGGRFDVKRCSEALAILTDQGAVLQDSR